MRNNTLIIILLIATGLGLIIYDGMTQPMMSFDVGIWSLIGGALLGVAWIFSHDVNY